MEQVGNRGYPIATRTRRTGLILSSSSVGSRVTSLTAAALPIRWDASTYSNEVPLQVRFKAENAMRLFSDLGTEGSSEISRLIVGSVPGSTTYTSIASATWSEFEDVVENFRSTSEDGASSNVLCYVAGTGLFSYEVRTVSRDRI